MATTITAQTLLRNADNDTIFVASAGAAFNPGDVTTVGDGRVGIVQGLTPVASGDPMTLRVTGQYDALKNATTMSMRSVRRFGGTPPRRRLRRPTRPPIISWRLREGFCQR
jgi:hypothetical protein